MLRIYDVSLRDGNHAVRHSITTEQVAKYCREIDDSGVDYVEVGHGIGLGASSLLIGEAKITDKEVLETARAQLKSAKLSVHVVPGYATCKKDLEPAITLGVDAIRVATQCSEADTAMQHLEFVREQGVSAFGGLMMSHMLSPEELVQQAKKLESYGAETITLLDSAGKFMPKDVYQRIALLVDHLQVPVGFHGHNNLGLAIANSLAAIEAGANMIDASIIGFGAGAGNAALEVLAGACSASEVETKLDLYKILDIAEYADSLMGYRPCISSDSIVSGLTGVVSVFSKPVRKAADHYGVDPRDIYFELGKRKAIAGQEDLIHEIAAELAGRS